MGIESDLMSCIEELQKTKNYNSGHLFNKNKVANADLLELAKEEDIELIRKIGTTHRVTDQ